MHRRRDRQLAIVLGGVVQRRRPAASDVDAEHPGLDQVGEGLEGEQRIAAGGAPESAGEAFAARAAGEGAHQLEHCRFVERLERDRGRSGRTEHAGQRPGNLVLRLAGPQGDDDRTRFLIAPPAPPEGTRGVDELPVVERGRSARAAPRTPGQARRLV